MIRGSWMPRARWCVLFAGLGRERRIGHRCLASQLLHSLSRLNWNSGFVSPDHNLSIAVELGGAIEELNDRLQRLAARKDSILSQLSTAHLIKGALTAAQATRAKLELQKTLHERAIVDFRESAKIYEDKASVLAKECEGVSLSLAGDPDRALEAFSEMETIASASKQARIRLPDAVAIVKWRQAEVHCARKNFGKAKPCIDAAVLEAEQILKRDLDQLFRLASMYKTQCQTSFALNHFTRAEVSRDSAIQRFQEVNSLIGAKLGSWTERMFRHMFSDRSLDGLLAMRHDAQIAEKQLRVLVRPNRPAGTADNATDPTLNSQRAAEHEPLTGTSSLEMAQSNKGE